MDHLAICYYKTYTLFAIFFGFKINSDKHSYTYILRSCPVIFLGYILSSRMLSARESVCVWIYSLSTQGQSVLQKNDKFKLPISG